MKAKLPRRLPRPRSWPVRWRLTAVSAGLTLLILLLFGGAIGKIATERIRDDFNEEVRSAAKILGGELAIVYPPFSDPEARRGPSLDAFVLPDDASAKIFDANGNPIEESRDAANLGPLHQGLVDFGDMRVATATITSELGAVTGYVQYGRSLDRVNSTIERVWLLIAAAIFAGTLLAIFAGVALGRPALGPEA